MLPYFAPRGVRGFMGWGKGMSSVRVGMIFTILGIVSGCAAIMPQPISTSRIVEVVDDAKRQVSIYQAYQNTHRIISRTHYCGNGLIDFDVKQVKLDLLTTLDNTVAGGVSVASLPLGPAPSAKSGAAGSTLGLSFSQSIEGTNTQELIFVANPILDPTFRYYPKEGEPPAPLADVMVSLRNGLILESDQPHRICFQTVSSGGGGGGADQSQSGGSSGGNSFKFAVTTVSDTSGKLTLALAPLSPFGLSASGETKSTTGNTITFTFAPHNFGPPPKPKPKPTQNPNPCCCCNSPPPKKDGSG
jgi:hypothetical protein